MNDGTHSGDQNLSKPPTPIVRDAEALFRRGVDALERNHFHQAVGSLQQAATIDPEFPTVHLALGIAHMRLLQIPEATVALETAIANDPEGFYPHLRMAELYMRIGVPSRAREELDLAMDLSSNTEERKIVRTLLAVEAGRAPRRVWRPDFARLLGRKAKS